MLDRGRISDKGKEKATSPVKKRDFMRPQSQDKLELQRENEKLLGGMNQEESSSQQQESTRGSGSKTEDFASKDASSHQISDRSHHSQLSHYPISQQEVKRRIAQMTTPDGNKQVEQDKSDYQKWAKQSHALRELYQHDVNTITKAQQEYRQKAENLRKNYR